MCFLFKKANVNLIQNGDFEQNIPEFCATSTFCYETNSAIISPWYVPSGSSYNNIQVDKSVPAASGTWFLDLNSDKQYSIAQDVSTIIGQSYSLVFYIRSNNNNVLGTNPPSESVFKGQFAVTGSATQSFSTSSATWTKVTFSFSATQKTTTIAIWSTTPGSYGPYVDNVQLLYNNPNNIPLTPAPPATNPLSTMVNNFPCKYKCAVTY